MDGDRQFAEIDRLALDRDVPPGSVCDALDLLVILHPLAEGRRQRRRLAAECCGDQPTVAGEVGDDRHVEAGDLVEADDRAAAGAFQFEDGRGDVELAPHRLADMHDLVGEIALDHRKEAAHALPIHDRLRRDACVTLDPIALSPGEVHVWRISFAAAAAAAQTLETSLDGEERARADRYRFAEDRQRSGLSRAILRHLLGAACNVAPEAIRFCYGAHGKPALREPQRDVSFNLAHSGDVGLIALTRGRDIGLDVERVRAEAATFAIAERFFAAAEVAALRALPPGQRLDAFFRCWTSKEAFIKARGLGLSLPLDSFVVALMPDLPAALLAVDGDPAAAAAWRLTALPVAAGYAAALCVAGSGWRLSLHDWPA